MRKICTVSVLSSDLFTSAIRTQLPDVRTFGIHVERCSGHMWARVHSVEDQVATVHATLWLHVVIVPVFLLISKTASHVVMHVVQPALLLDQGCAHTGARRPGSKVRA